MKIHFSEPNPHTVEACVLEVEKMPTLSVVNLQKTSLPPYSARMGDRLMVIYGLDTWEASVIYFGEDRKSVV